MFASVKIKSISATALYVKKATSAEYVTVHPEVASRDVQNLWQRRQIPSRTGLRISPSTSRRRCHYYTLFTSGTSTCDYLLAMRSCRGRGGPSKRVSDIHASVHTHPSPVTRNMRSEGSPKMHA